MGLTSFFLKTELLDFLSVVEINPCCASLKITYLIVHG